MKSQIAAILFFSILISACSKNSPDKSKSTDSTEKRTTAQTSSDINSIKPENILGKWVSGEFKMGFDIKEGGKVSSINMATLDYNSWQLIENKLILNSTSKGVSNPVTTNEIYIIREITPSSMLISPSNNPDAKWTYTKEQ